MSKKYYAFTLLCVLIFLTGTFSHTQNPVKNPIKWKMVTTWPKNMPIFQDSAEKFAADVKLITNGQLDIEVFAFDQYKNDQDKNMETLEDVFNEVSKGKVQMGHSAPYYWAENDKIPGCEFMGTVPFGLNARGMYDWFYMGRGLELWRELYEPFKVIPFPVGNTGPAFGGWFKKKIETMNDLKGLKIRIAGLGSKVYRKAGADPRLLPASQILDALEKSDSQTPIDAAVFQGPFHDRWLRLDRDAKYYYYPGWHEPGAVIELIINKEAWEKKLNDDLREKIKIAIGNSYQDIYTRFENANLNAYQEMKEQDVVKLEKFPIEVIERFKQLTGEVFEEEAKRSDQFKRIYEAYKKFEENYKEWRSVSDTDYTSGIIEGTTASKFTRELGNTQISSVRAEGINSAVIYFSGDASFEFNSAIPKPGLSVEIDRIAKILKNYPIRLIRVEGHTDSKGKPFDNWVMSKNRAYSIVNLLIKNGIKETLIKAIPYGPSKPIFPDEKTDEDRRKNRRVEIVIEF